MFFTENSAGISYRELSYIINYREHLEFIKCAKGTNALDFQLVSYVGYLMKTGAKTKYIIVSNVIANIGKCTIIPSIKYFSFT